MASNTKDRILDIAETLFADHGFSATSLRDITHEAGVNIAAVNYHFGSKEALLGAVFDRRFAPVNRRRLEMLDEAEARAGGEAVDLDTLVRALLEPLFHQRIVVEGGATKFLQLAGRVHSEPHAGVQTILLAQFGEVVRRFVPAFRKALPHLDDEEVGWRLLFVIGAMAHTMMSTHMFEALGCRRPDDPERLLESLVQFAVGGLKARAVASSDATKSVKSGAVA